MTARNAEASGAGPLAGIVVVDLSRALAGPHAAMMLGDLGARVIKVEAPGGGDATLGTVRLPGPPLRFFAGPGGETECTRTAHDAPPVYGADGDAVREWARR